MRKGREGKGLGKDRERVGWDLGDGDVSSWRRGRAEPLRGGVRDPLISGPEEKKSTCSVVGSWAFSKAVDPKISNIPLL